MKARLVPVAAVAVLALVGCNQPGTGGPGSPGSSTPGSATAGTSPTSPTAPPPGATAGTAPPPPASEPPSTVTDFKITYGWGVPSGMQTVTNPVTVPIGGPNEPPLPYLVAIYVGDHPQESPKYQRISFYYRGAFPSYNVGYVAAVLSEGKGEPISLPGNAFLRVGFVDAQMHTASGATSLVASPHNPIGFTNLRGYGFAGDFEGHVTYGLGLQVAAGSDQKLKIRTGQLKKADGAGGSFYVVFVDVQTA